MKVTTIYSWRFQLKIKDFNVKDVGIVEGKLSVTLDLVVSGKTEVDEFTASAVVTLPFNALNMVFDLLKDKL